MQGSGACWPGSQSLGPGPALERRREPRLSWDCSLSETIQRPSRSADWGFGFETQQEVKILAAGSQPVRVAGSRPQGLWARSPGGLGPGPPGLGARPTRGRGLFPTKTHPNLSNYDFSQTSWREPGEGVGVG